MSDRRQGIGLWAETLPSDRSEVAIDQQDQSLEEKLDVRWERVRPR